MRLPDDVLPDRQRRALHAVATTLIDDAFDALEAGDGLKESMVAWYLPPRHSHQYVELTYRKMLVAVIGIGHQLAVTDNPSLRCTADELALHILLEQADNWLTEVEGGAPGDWGMYMDLVFEDADFEMLYDPSMDGVEDGDGDLAQWLRPANLHPRDWFRPFRSDEPVHPYFADSELDRGSQATD